MYTLNPYLPKLRAKAVEMARQGQSIRQVARYFGVYPSTVSRWNKKAPVGGCYSIPTKSSRPKHHPRELREEIIERIIALRKETNRRCSEVIHQYLVNENIRVSLSSVKRTLKRGNLLRRRSPWKKYHKYKERPFAANPGDLVQLDTIHLMKDKKSRMYVYTLIDLYSRWAHAWAVKKISSGRTIEFLKKAKNRFPYQFHCLQSDWGPEFGSYFSKRAKIIHRHSRVRKPNDNAHLERFNRTLQEEFLSELPKDVDLINKYLPKYLKYYNDRRLHLGINLKTPNQILSRCCQGID